MGNISNLWYLKNSGGYWASTKCALDDCYSIPFIPGEDNSLYLQADLPDGYGATQVWLTDMEGNHLQEMLTMTDWKIITGAGMNRLIFRVPQDSYACAGYYKERMKCISDLVWAGLPPSYLAYLSNYVLGLHNTHVFLLIDGAWYDIDGPLPAGYAKAGPTKMSVPCDTAPNALQWKLESNVGSANSPWPYPGVLGQVIGADIFVQLDCFRFEVPLINSSGVVTDTLLSEPFHCPACEETVKISSDYCRAATDIFGTFIFNTAGFGNEHYGALSKAKNDFRIQAVLKKMPSELKQDRNVRCNNFKSRVTKKYKLQGAMTDFPDYMVNIIESIFAGKHVYIDGEEYMADADTIFVERNIAGRSMKQLDIELTKCEKAMVFNCECKPPSCDDNPVSAFMFIIPAPHMGNMYGVDRSYVYAGFDNINGGVPPFTIDGWYSNAALPNSDLIPFDDHRNHNVFRRDDLTGGASSLTIIAYITDVRGCRYMVGNTINREDLTCVGYDGHFDAAVIGPGAVMISNVQPGGYADYDVYVDGGLHTANVTSDPFPLLFLSSGERSITIRMQCMDGVVSSIGPLRITVP